MRTVSDVRYVYVATINVPGYLPMADEPAVFDTAREAWEYLCEERERSEDDFEGEDYSDTVTKLRRWAANDMVCDFEKVGTIYGDTPGYEGDHDLGLAYSVAETYDEDGE